MKLTQLLVRCSAVVGIGIATLGQSVAWPMPIRRRHPRCQRSRHPAHSGYPYTSAHSRPLAPPLIPDIPHRCRFRQSGSAADPSDSRPQLFDPCLLSAHHGSRLRCSSGRQAPAGSVPDDARIESQR